MFVIGKERRAWWPVRWMGAPEDGGELVEHKIDMQFRLLDVDQLEAFRQRIGKLEKQLEDDPEEGKSKSAAFAEVVTEIATNWRGVGGENGEPLPWSFDNLRLLMGVSGLYTVVTAAYGDCLAGRAKVREGN